MPKQSPSKGCSIDPATIALGLSLQIERSFADPTSKSELLARYVGARGIPGRKPDEQSSLVYWGHTSPIQRELSKRDWEIVKTTKKLSDLSLIESWKVWLAVWSCSNIFEVKNVALLALSSPAYGELRLKRAKDLFALAASIDNWAHSDSLSSMLAAIIEAKPDLLSKYTLWNRSKNPWLRRQSIVGVYYYARLRKKHISPKLAFSLIEPLLEDSHFYVQRGVGWALREADRVDSEAQRKFVRKNLSRISSVAWFATSEFYPLKLRSELTDLRKIGRKRAKTKMLERVGHVLR